MEKTTEMWVGGQRSEETGKGWITVVRGSWMSILPSQPETHP